LKDTYERGVIIGLTLAYRFDLKPGIKLLVIGKDCLCEFGTRANMFFAEFKFYF